MPWYEWTEIGGAIKESPAVASMGPGRLDAVGWDRNTGNVVHSSYADGRWSDWADLGGPFSSAPAISAGPKGFDVVARGMDKNLYMRTWQGSWSGWTNLGGPFNRVRWTPANASAGPGHGGVFGIGDDGSLNHRAWDQRTGWGDWESLGGNFLSGPWAFSMPGGFVVLAADRENRVWGRAWAEDRWTEWDHMGDMPVPAAVTASWTQEPRNGITLTDMQIDLLALQADGNLWRRYGRELGDWESDWENLGGPVVGAGAASWAPGRLDVLATGQNGRVYHKVWTGT